MAAVWAKFSGPFSARQVQMKSPGISSVLSADYDLDRLKPQKQAEILLERAVARSHGDADQVEAQIESRVEAWRGKLKWDAQLGELTTAALNSSDRGVRDSAIEVQLAAYGLTKNESTVDALVKQAGSADHSKKIWAFWTLGLLANRGIETDRVVQVLTEHLKDADRGGDDKSEDSRRWAVEGLALVGTTPTIVPLLDAMHNDPSPMVRQRAAASLAESGMFTQDQRLIAVPQLINYSEDPALDSQTRGWAFQALGDITKQHLPNDSAAWRNWYQNSVVSGQ
jgi:HEAT repeat protein